MEGEKEMSNFEFLKSQKQYAMFAPAAIEAEIKNQKS